MNSLNHIMKNGLITGCRFDAMPARQTSRPEIDIAVRIGSICKVCDILDLNNGVLRFRRG